MPCIPFRLFAHINETHRSRSGQRLCLDGTKDGDRGLRVRVRAALGAQWRGQDGERKPRQSDAPRDHRVTGRPAAIQPVMPPPIWAWIGRPSFAAMPSAWPDRMPPLQ